MDPIVAQFSTSAVIVALIEWLKETKLIPMVNQHSAGLNRAIALFFATLSGLGLGYMYDPTAGVLTITGIQGSHIFNTLLSILSSYGTQWLIYKGVIRKPVTSEGPSKVEIEGTPKIQVSRDGGPPGAPPQDGGN